MAMESSVPVVPPDEYMTMFVPGSPTPLGPVPAAGWQRASSLMFQR